MTRPAPHLTLYPPMFMSYNPVVSFDNVLLPHRKATALFLYQGHTNPEKVLL
jgi:hypothetical protein